MKLRVGRRTDIVIPTPGESLGPRTREGGNMYARLTTLSFRTDLADEGLRIFETSVVPAARAQKGFRAAYLLGDRKTGRSVAVTLWDDEAAALANEQNRYYQEQLVKFLPIITSPPIKEGFEVELFVEAD
jgi:heme-degrading monooxygenase HmoA